MIGFLVLGTLGFFMLPVIVAIPCSPDHSHHLAKQGHCVRTKDVEESCGVKQLEISVSKDCIGFDGSWCCYNATSLRKNSDLSEIPGAQVATTAASTNTTAFGETDLSATRTTVSWNALTNTESSECAEVPRVTSTINNILSASRNTVSDATASTLKSSELPVTPISTSNSTTSIFDSVVEVTNVNVSDIQRLRCTLDLVPGLRDGETGVCSSTEDLNTFCAPSKLEIGVSKDCAQLSGSWCCYNASSLKNRSDTEKCSSEHGSSRLAPITEIPGLPVATTELDTTTFVTSVDMVAEVQEVSCTPNALPQIHLRGFCAANDDLQDLCIQLDMQIGMSSDCSEFDGSWCCYNVTWVRNSMLLAVTKHQQAMTFAATTSVTKGSDETSVSMVTAASTPLVIGPKKTCTPDFFPGVHTQGKCVNNFELMKFCVESSEISVSKDCSDFDGSWCCYNVTSVRSKSPVSKILQQPKESIAEPIIRPPFPIFRFGRLITNPSLDTKTDEFSVGSWTSMDIAKVLFGKTAVTLNTTTLPSATIAAVDGDIQPSNKETFSKEETNISEKTVANDKEVRCTPDAAPFLHWQGICASTDHLQEDCGRHDLQIGPSNDCLEFVGSWCCYSVISGGSQTLHTKIEQHDDDVMQNIKKEKLPWKPARNMFYKKSYKEKRKFLGHKDVSVQIITGVVPVAPEKFQSGFLLPSFDARTHWAMCNSSISDIPDQGTCRSCWAHSTAAVLSDRICIKSAGATKFKASVQDQINCMPATYSPWPLYTDLCQGFNTQMAMRMLVNQGLVSNDCMPYVDRAWSAGTGEVHFCKTICSNSHYGKTYTADKHFGTNIVLMGYKLASWGLSANSSYSLNATTGGIQSRNSLVDSVENLIKYELMTNGPVTATFDVHNDFLSYSTGIYQKSSTAVSLGGHAVKMIGWGVSAGIPYWLCVNSWSSRWGENGLFRILRGSNHVDIESYIVTTTV